MSREEFLRTIIEDRYGSLRAFTKNIGMPYTTLVSILKRGIGNTSVDNILKICKHLGIPPESLYEDDVFFHDKSNITLIRNITQLSTENKKLVLDYINFLKNSTHSSLFSTFKSSGNFMPPNFFTCSCKNNFNNKIHNNCKYLCCNRSKWINNWAFSSWLHNIFLSNFLY